MPRRLLKVIPRPLLLAIFCNITFLTAVQKQLFGRHSLLIQFNASRSTYKKINFTLKGILNLKMKYKFPALVYLTCSKAAQAAK